MIGYSDYNDARLQPPEDPNEERFIEIAENVAELLRNNGYDTLLCHIEDTRNWINGIEAMIEEEHAQRNMV